MMAFNFCFKVWYLDRFTALILKYLGVKSRKKGSRASGSGAVELAIDLQFFVSQHIGAIITGLAAVM